MNARPTLVDSGRQTWRYLVFGHRLERYQFAGLTFDFASQAYANSRNPNVCGLRLLSLTSEGHSIFYTFFQCPKRLKENFKMGQGAGGRKDTAAAIQIPAQGVTAARLQPLIATVCRKKPLDRFRGQGIGRDPDAIPAPVAIQSH